MMFLALLFAFSVAGPRTTYQPLRDITWSRCNQGEFAIEDYDKAYPVEYTYCTNLGYITPSFIERYIKEASLEVFNFIYHIGLSPNECRSNTYLEVYEIDTDMLNDHRRFNEWQYNNPNTKTIWALYDARSEDRSVSSIVLTSHQEWDRLNLAHELSHYWYDRLCIASQYNYQTEKFAQKFESYYQNR
jgi:hypothetical protein